MHIYVYMYTFGTYHSSARPISCYFCSRELGVRATFRASFSNLHQDSCNSNVLDGYMPVWLSNFAENHGTISQLMVHQHVLPGNCRYMLQHCRYKIGYPNHPSGIVHEINHPAIGFFSTTMETSTWYNPLGTIVQDALTCCCAKSFKSCSKVADTPMDTLTEPRKFVPIFAQMWKNVNIPLEKNHVRQGKKTMKTLRKS